MYKPKLLILCTVIIVLSLLTPVYAETIAPEISAPSALLMDYSTGEILYEKNPHEKKPMASVTKIMTMLIAMEEIDAGNLSYDDIITASAHAKSYGGSTIFLEEGEQMSVTDILKGVAVASGNDAAVALGEHISGTEAAFVQRMNQRAAELGMTNTNFVNCNGLDADGHYSTAYDIALMSRELMKHPDIFTYTTIWMDSLRGGAFTLSNTNKLVRFYEGSTGLKTGSTSKAGFCISATAKRDNMHLIAVIMAAETSKSRQADASALLNYGFSTFAVTQPVSCDDGVGSIRVEKGTEKMVDVMPAENCNVVTAKNDKCEFEVVTNPNKKIKAPVNAGDVAGTLTVFLNGNEYKTINLVCAQSIPKASFSFVFKELLTDWLC
ncbi:MAG: D-alanyl-D-alanine carboxypeptidase [Ruminococcaceae bacterium]|nr:D-alanyl-D-alanine carboxypeptidase [Oscillospiraceae bacterium]